MVKFIKGGLITRIDILYCNKKGKKFLDEFFDFEYCIKKDNSYFIREDILNDEFNNLRLELISFTDSCADCLKNSEAYCLGTTVKKLLKGNIHLFDSNKFFYFDNYENIRYETVLYRIRYNYLSINIYFICLIWDISEVFFEDEYIFNILINKLTRKALKNRLRYLTWFTVTS